MPLPSRSEADPPDLVKGSAGAAEGPGALPGRRSSGTLLALAAACRDLAGGPDAADWGTVADAEPPDFGSRNGGAWLAAGAVDSRALARPADA